MSEPDYSHTALPQYIELDATFYRIFERYRPDVETLEQVRDVQPEAHVITATRYACPDCARNVPRMAKLAEHLPGWTWEVLDSESNEECMAALSVQRVPTFIVYDHKGGEELGRIIENPISGSLIGDLLAIVETGV